MGLLPAKKKLKKSYDIDSYYLNLASTITNRKNVTIQKHNEILEKRICEDNANFLNPRELEISIYNPLTNQQLDNKLINNFLKMQDFTNKNWYNEYKINKNGKGAYFIFANNSKLNFITIDFYNDQYNELGNLVSFTSRVSKINEIEQGADIWLNYHQSDSGFILNLICTKDKIVIKGWPKNNEVVVGQSKTQIKDDVRPVLIQEFKNKLGIVPFWEMINEPNPLFLSTSTTLNPWPTMANCYKLQFDLEDSFNIKSKERYANRTHWYGILSDDLMTAYNKGNKKVLQDRLHPV